MNSNRNFKKLSEADIALKLVSASLQEQASMLELLLEQKTAPSILAEIPEAQLKPFLEKLPEKYLVKIFSEGPIDDLIYLLDFTPNTPHLLQKLPAKQQVKIRNFLNYPEETVGRIMEDEYFSLSADISCEEGIQRLRDYSKNKFAHYIYYLSEDQELLGILSIRELVTSPSKSFVSEVINKNVISVSALENQKQAAELVAKHNFLAIPVVDVKNRILGLVTVDDVLDVIKEEAVTRTYAQAGLPEDDRVYSSPIASIKNRMPWIILNLFFALLASSIISLFEQTMNRLILLATLKNIVAGIGGNTAIQTLTVTTRGLDTGDFNFTSLTRALIKESFVGLFLGLVVGLGASLITYVWKGDLLVSLVIFIAMLINSLVGVLAGFLLPILIRKLGKDPAVSSGVLVTMLTDIFGFFVFLGIAQLGLDFIQKTL